MWFVKKKSYMNYYYFVHHIWITFNNSTLLFLFSLGVQTPLALTHVHKTWVIVSLEFLHIGQIASTGTPRVDKLSKAGKELLNDLQRINKTFSPFTYFILSMPQLLLFFVLFASSLFIYFYLFVLLILITGKLLSPILLFKNWLL